MGKIKRKLKKIRIHHEGTDQILYGGIGLVLVALLLWFGIDSKIPFGIFCVVFVTIYCIVLNFYRCPIRYFPSEDTDKILGLNIGADDYITKPFRPLEMIARVKSQLRRYQKYNPAHSDTGETSSAASEDNLVCGSLTMNIKAHTCFLGETPLVLTPTEFSILRILLENTGNVVSSEDLFHKIWQDEYYSKSNNTITVHIRHLREKMGDSMDKPRFIKTIWGGGYKIES